MIIVYKSYTKSKYYISSITIDDCVVILSISYLNNKLEGIQTQMTDLKVDIYQNLHERYPGYRLELRRKSLTKKYGFDLMVKQYESGFWKRNKMKQIFKIISDKQGMYSGTNFIK